MPQEPMPQEPVIFPFVARVNPRAPREVRSAAIVPDFVSRVDLVRLVKVTLKDGTTLYLDESSIVIDGTSFYLESKWE